MLPTNFRKLPIDRRIEALAREYGYDVLPPSIVDVDTMIETAIGYSSIPLGVVPRVLVNERHYTVPMATEEPSVVAAQTFAAAIIGHHGGVQSESGKAIGTGQIFIQRCERALYRKIKGARAQLMAILDAECASLRKRGGGVVGAKLQWQRLGKDSKRERAAAGMERRVALFEFTVNTVDAMGANRIILIAEKVAQWLRNNLQCDILMSILSNDMAHAPSTAQFRLPISALKATIADPARVAHKIIMANAVANANRKRAVTHNKGIMNGICALATATGNDTRAIEAAAHGYAARNGRYRTLTDYAIHDSELHARLTVPLPLATVGGATTSQHHARQAFAILGIERASELKEVAAAVGLQQNFAALLALTSVGIARGHMPLQRRRTAQK